SAAAAIRSLPPRTILTGREFRDGSEVTPHNLSFWGHQEAPPGEGALHGICINATIFPRQLFDVVTFAGEWLCGSEEADIAGQAVALGSQIVVAPALVAHPRRSPVGREETSLQIDASRLYSTYKRSRWIDRRPWKAAASALLSPLHL